MTFVLSNLTIQFSIFKLGARNAFVVVMLLIGSLTNAQSFNTSFIQKKDTIDYNTSYIKSYSDKLTTRMFFSRKYTNLQIEDEQEGFQLRYEPNSTLNLGAGLTVNSISLNLSYHFKFLNPENDKGSTRQLDLQSHVYTRTWVIDLFAQFYKGLYLDNTRELAPNYEKPYYVRNDIYQQLLGGSALYLFNNSKFSYRAPFIQNERQLKSAGSFLLGGEASYGIIRADSALLPSFQYDKDVSHLDSISRFAFLKIGPSAGYVYSFVIAEKFFATLSLTLNLSYGANVIHHESMGSKTNSQLNLGGFARWAVGYNDDNWYLGFMSVNATVTSANEDRNMTAYFGVGNYRLNFIWRFHPGPKLQKYKNFIP